MNMKYIETHAHLDSLTALPLEETIKKANSVGVEKLITIATDLSNLERVIEIANNFACVYTTQGLHPHNAKEFSVAVTTKLLEESVNQNRSKVVAIGEIGLDYHYNFSTPAEQRLAFEAQLELAIKLKLPVVIHSREADEDMMAIIKNAAAALPSGRLLGVFHSYSSGRELAECALDLGFYLGFNGMITFKKADNVREVVAMTPIERIVVETDAPYLAPIPHRGQENAPHFIPVIAEKLSSLKNTPLSELAPKLYQNSCTLFHLSF
ncbi:MAG: TatD family hydrolase [Oligoflexia bacterium]|nr:TatD family hydrolase [Oligoflexia bacterium]MBF0365887.1 TatD family hydrolase [Oligoflexia bacterium]